VPFPGLSELLGRFRAHAGAAACVIGEGPDPQAARATFQGGSAARARRGGAQSRLPVPIATRSRSRTVPAGPGAWLGGPIRRSRCPRGRRRSRCPPEQRRRYERVDQACGVACRDSSGAPGRADTRLTPSGAIRPSGPRARFPIFATRACSPPNGQEHRCAAEAGASTRIVRLAATQSKPLRKGRPPGQPKALPSAPPQFPPQVPRSWRGVIGGA
jgi:hypothetical protein